MRYILVVMQQILLCSLLVPVYASNGSKQVAPKRAHEDAEDNDERDEIDESDTDIVELLQVPHTAHYDQVALSTITGIEHLRNAIQTYAIHADIVPGRKQGPTLRQLQESALACSDAGEGWTSCCEEIEGIPFCTSFSSDGLSCKLEIAGIECDKCALCNGEEGLGFDCTNIVNDPSLKENDDCETTTTPIDPPPACEFTTNGGYKCCYPLVYQDTNVTTRFRGCTTFFCPGGGSTVTDACSCEITHEGQLCRSCEVCYVKEEDGTGYFVDANYDCSNTGGLISSSSYSTSYWYGASENYCYREPTPKPTRAPTFPTAEPTLYPTQTPNNKAFGPTKPTVFAMTALLAMGIAGIIY